MTQCTFIGWTPLPTFTVPSVIKHMQLDKALHMVDIVGVGEKKMNVRNDLAMKQTNKLYLYCAKYNQ